MNSFQLKWCKRCPEKLDHFTERKGKSSVKKKVGDHYHYGHPYFKYGICSKYHFTKIKKIRTQWDVCQKCKKKETNLVKKREHMAARARLEKKQVPSFLRDELDRFKQKIERKLRKKLELEIQKRVDEEVTRRMKKVHIAPPMYQWTECIVEESMLIPVPEDDDFFLPPVSRSAPESPKTLIPSPINSPRTDDYTDVEESSITVSFTPPPPPPSPPNSPPQRKKEIKYGHTLNIPNISPKYSKVVTKPFF